MVIVPHELELGDLSRRQGAAIRAARRGFITVDLPRPRERSKSRFMRYREGRDCASSACIEQAVNSPAFVGWQGRKLKGHQNGIDLQSVFTIRFYLSRSGKVLSTAHKGLLQTMERAFLCHLGDGSNNAVYRKNGPQGCAACDVAGAGRADGQAESRPHQATLCPRQAGPKLGYGVTARNLADS